MYGAIQFLKHTARLGALVALSGTALASESWLQTQVSPHIFKLNQAVSYKVEPPRQWQHRSDPIKRVELQLSYRGNATVSSQLCLATSYRCVNVVGSHLNTEAFKNEPINSAFFVVHTVHRWNGADPNVFIKSSLIVWAGH